MDDNKNEFVREKIKSKPVNKKRMLEKFLIALGCGLIAAVVFCLVTALALPMILKKRGVDLSALKGQTTETATEEETTAEEISIQTEAEESQAEEIPDTDAEELAGDPAAEVVEPISPEDYQNMMKEVYAVGGTARLSTVTVTSITESTDWFNRDVESKGSGLGVVIDRTDAELYILTDSNLITNAKSIQVTLQDNEFLTAELVSQDAGTGLAVVKVAADDLTLAEDTVTVEIPTTTSVGTSAGDIVIAIQHSGMYAGLVTSTAGETYTYDHNYSVISTDITAASDEPGILVNLNGQMIGMILPDFQSADEVSAIPVAQLKTVIDYLTEAKPIPYLGLSVSTVTDGIAEQYGIPEGVYVSKVAMDSPAMLAGIQAGDVVVSINGNDARTDGIYTTHLLGCNVGDQIEIKVMRLSASGYSEITYDVTIGQQ